MSAIQLFDYQYSDPEKHNLKVVSDIESTVSGSINNIENTSYIILVMAYKIGEYKGNEIKGYRSNKAAFTDTIASSIIYSTSSSYMLNIFEEGEYELHFASFYDPNNDGEFEYTGMLDIETVHGSNLKNVVITSKHNVTLNVEIKGIL